MSGVCIIYGLLGPGMSSPPTGCTQLLMKPLPYRPSSGWSLPPKTGAGLSADPVGWRAGGAELWASDRFHDYMYDHALHVPDGSSASQASAPTLISESLVPLPSQS